jgi:hypothetical protein
MENGGTVPPFMMSELYESVQFHGPAAFATGKGPHRDGMGSRGSLKVVKEITLQNLQNSSACNQFLY